jgi:Ca2+/H+ antiporter
VSCTQDGTSNWLKGAMLILTYIFVAAGFWVHKDPSLKLDADG